MAKVYAQLDERLTKFIVAQPISLVATAPCLGKSGEGGQVNVSPKGYRDTFTRLGPRTVDSWPRKSWPAGWSASPRAADTRGLRQQLLDVVPD